MFLVIKNTLKCNLSCWFCSDSGDSTMDLGKVKEIYFKEKPEELLIIGGEPMILGTDYYKDLLDSGVKFSIQTNLTLYDSSWDEIFCHKNFTGLSVSGDKFSTFEEFYSKYIDVRRVVKYAPLVLVVTFNVKETLDWYKRSIDKEFPVKFNYLVPVGKCEGQEMLVSSYFDTMSILVDEWDASHTVEPLSSIFKYMQNEGKRTCPYINCISNDVDIYSIEPDGKKFFCCVLSSLRVSREEFMGKLSIPPKCFSCEYFEICRGCMVRSYMAENDSRYCDSIKRFFRKIKERANAGKEVNLLCKAN